MNPSSTMDMFYSHVSKRCEKQLQSARIVELVAKDLTAWWISCSKTGKIYRICILLKSLIMFVNR